MSFLVEYRAAKVSEDAARLRRALALRALAATGSSQAAIGAELGVSQPAISQQLKAARDLVDVHPEVLVDAAAPVLRALAAARGYGRLAVFGSVARGEARPDSDIDLLVESPAGISSLSFLRFKALLTEVLGRPVDLVDWGSLTPGLDDDIRREAVVL